MLLCVDVLRMKGGIKAYPMIPCGVPTRPPRSLPSFLEDPSIGQESLSSSTEAPSTVRNPTRFVSIPKAITQYWQSLRTPVRMTIFKSSLEEMGMVSNAVVWYVSMNCSSVQSMA